MKILGSPFDIRAKQYVISYENSGAGNLKIVRSSSLATQVEHRCAPINKCVVQDERWVCGSHLCCCINDDGIWIYERL